MKFNPLIVYKVYLGLWSSYHLLKKNAAFAANLDEAQVCTSRLQATQATKGQPS
jgi:hypothetical protein